MSTRRDQVLRVTGALMEKHGYHATGISEIVRESGTPKGYIYYCFPDGKEQIASEAILRAGQAMAEQIRAGLENEPDTAAAIYRSICLFADFTECSGYSAGSLLVTIAMEMAAKSQRINEACRHAFDLLIDSFKTRLLAGGMDESEADGLAKFIVSALQGGLVLSRTDQNAQPLRHVAEHVYRTLKSAKRPAE